MERATMGMAIPIEFNKAEPEDWAIIDLEKSLMLSGKWGSTAPALRAGLLSIRGSVVGQVEDGSWVLGMRSLENGMPFCIKITEGSAKRIREAEAEGKESS